MVMIMMMMIRVEEKANGKECHRVRKKLETETANKVDEIRFDKTSFS